MYNFLTSLVCPSRVEMHLASRTFSMFQTLTTRSPPALYSLCPLDTILQMVPWWPLSSRKLLSCKDFWYFKAGASSEVFRGWGGREGQKCSPGKFWERYCNSLIKNSGRGGRGKGVAPPCPLPLPHRPCSYNFIVIIQGKTLTFWLQLQLTMRGRKGSSSIIDRGQRF